MTIDRDQMYFKSSRGCITGRVLMLRGTLCRFTLRHCDRVLVREVVDLGAHHEREQALAKIGNVSPKCERAARHVMTNLSRAVLRRARNAAT